jgi:hypothetical protein
MLLAAEAWHLRGAARTAIAQGKFAHGFELAARAQQLQRTSGGDALRRLSQWLREETCRQAVQPGGPEQASGRSPSSSWIRR